MFYVVALVVAVLVLLALIGSNENRKAEKKVRLSQLENWKKAESRDVKRPRDARTKFCVANLGRPVNIQYHGGTRTIVPRRVFTKPKFRKTYVLAEENGECRTFDIDDMTLIAGQQADQS